VKYDSPVSRFVTYPRRPMGLQHRTLEAVELVGPPDPREECGHEEDEHVQKQRSIEVL